MYINKKHLKNSWWSCIWIFCINSVEISYPDASHPDNQLCQSTWHFEEICREFYKTNLPWNYRFSGMCSIVLWLLELQIRRDPKTETQVNTVNSNSRTPNSQCSLFSKKNPIIQYISNKMQRYTVYLYLETSLHVSGGISTHHQEHTQLYPQHLVLVKPVLLPATIAAGSSTCLTSTRCVLLMMGGYTARNM